MTKTPTLRRSLATIAAGFAAWLDGLRGAAALRAKTPDQREDLGLTLSDMRRLGA